MTLLYQSFSTRKKVCQLAAENYESLKKKVGCIYAKDNQRLFGSCQNQLILKINTLDAVNPTGCPGQRCSLGV